MPITVSIVEDDRNTRDYLAKLLGGAPALSCVGAYPDAETAVRGIPTDNPDVALVDINLPGMSGIECVGRLKAALPGLQILMLTMYEERDVIFNSLRAGAGGYLLKKMPPAELIQAVEQVHGGGAPMSMQIARKVVDYYFHRKQEQPVSEVETLTPREQEILELLAKGRFYKEISERLGITLSTVKGHVQHIYEKLHVQSRTEAALKYLGRPGRNSDS